MNKPFSSGIAGNTCINHVNDPNVADPPVAAAIRRVQDEISECHYWVDLLIASIGPALRGPRPSEERPPRLEGASPLSDAIEQIAENLRNIREKVVDARERLTL